MQLWLLASPAKSLHWLLQETGMFCSSCQRAARKGRIRHTVLVLSRNFNRLTCKKEWPTASGFTRLLAKTQTPWTWHVVLMKLGCTCQDMTAHRLHMWAAANPHANHKAFHHPQKVGGVIFSVYCPHNWPHIFHTCQHQCLPWHFSRICTAAGWPGADTWLFSTWWGNM
jgi:hypothetical protein